MTVITKHDAEVRHLSRGEMRAELDALVADAGMTESELRAAGAAWALDAHHRGCWLASTACGSCSTTPQREPGGLRPHRQARDFAADLTRTVRAVAGPGCSEFRADVPEVADESTSTVVLIGQQPADGIALNVRGVPLLTLTVAFECSRDSARDWLTVLKSSMRVHGPDEFSTEPLVRYEYQRASTRSSPPRTCTCTGSTRP